VSHSFVRLLHSCRKKINILQENFETLKDLSDYGFWAFENSMSQEINEFVFNKIIIIVCKLLEVISSFKY
jgi:hypothetical protein